MVNSFFKLETDGNSKDPSKEWTGQGPCGVLQLFGSTFVENLVLRSVNTNGKNKELSTSNLSGALSVYLTQMEVSSRPSMVYFHNPHKSPSMVSFPANSASGGMASANSWNCSSESLSIVQQRLGLRYWKPCNNFWSFCGTPMIDV